MTLENRKYSLLLLQNAILENGSLSKIAPLSSWSRYSLIHSTFFSLLFFPCLFSMLSPSPSSGPKILAATEKKFNKQAFGQGHTAGQWSGLDDNQMGGSTRAGVGPFSAKQNRAGCLLNKYVQKEKKEGREEKMNEWKRFQKGLESFCSDSASP